jgi:DNA processing protein
VTTERRARAWLSANVEPGLPAVAALIATVGAGEAMRAISTGRSVPGVTARPDRDPHGTADAVLATASRLGLQFVCPGDELWPAGLDDLAHVGDLHGRGGLPYGLWFRGADEQAVNAARSVAIVGARASTTYGDDTAGDLAAELADAGVAVVSGAAYGIDAAAHRGALAVRGRTIAVLACGADVAYPRAHEGLLGRIVEVGLVISEAPPGAAPTRVRFLARNRLIAAMTQALVVVEASWRSGALNSLSWAHDLGRVCLGVPGPVTSTASTGVHRALRDRKAELVTGPQDVLAALQPIGSGFLGETDSGRGEHRPTDGLDPIALRLLESLPAQGSVALAEAADGAGVLPQHAERLLQALADRNLVECAGGRWQVSRRLLASGRRGGLPDGQETLTLR